jgi:PAS domain S-box-containing protein
MPVLNSRKLIEYVIKRIFHRGIILVGTPLLLGLMLAGALSILMWNAERDRTADADARRLTSLIARQMVLGNELVCAGIFARMQGGNQKLINLLQQDAASFRSNGRELEKACRQHPEIIPAEQTHFLSEYNKLFGRYMDEGLVPSPANEAANSLLTNYGSASQQDVQSFYQQSALFQGRDTQARLAGQLSSVLSLGNKICKVNQAKLDNTIKLQCALLALSLVIYPIIFFLLAVFYRRGILNRIRVIAKNTDLLATGEPLLASVGGQDEIAMLDRAFHDMYRQLQAASETERSLFNNASDVICVLDKQDRFLRINPACSKHWEYEQEELTGQRIDCLLFPEEVQRVRESVELARSSPGSVTFESCIHARQSGKRVALWSVYWAPSEECLFCIVHDITEQKQVESMRRAFLAMVGSDLRKPLAGITDSFSRILSALGSTASKARDKFLAVKKNLLRLMALVNDLLQVAELEFGVLKLRCQETDLSELLERALQDLEFPAKDKKLTLELRAPACSVLADSHRIMQVVVNLLSNAIRFSPEGSTITLELEPGEKQVVCKVRDRGRGVPASQINTIFERFSQVQVADGKRKAGTGLGLPICKQIVESHGGQIGVESREGEGSTFWFSLPVDGPTTELLAILPQAGPGACPVAAPSAASRSGAEIGKRRGFRIPLALTGIVLVGVPFLIGLWLAGSLAWSSYELTEERRREIHQREIAFKAFELMSNFTTMLNIVYMNPLLTDRDSAVRQYQAEYVSTLKQLEELLNGDGESLKHLDKIRNSFEKSRNANLSLNIFNIGQIPDPAAQLNMMQMLVRTTSSMVVQTRNLASIIERAEAIEFASPEKELAIRQKELQILLAGLAASILVSLALAAQFSMSISKRLFIMADNTGRVAGEETLNPLIGGNDELSDLDASFHKQAALLLEARQKERAVFDNCKDVICTLSMQGRFLTSNPAAELLWGYAKKELTETSMLDLIPAAEREITRQAIFSQPDRDGDIVHECRMVTKDGRTRHCLWSVSQRREQEAIFCIVYDVTDKKELDELRNDFLSIVSHDLRTPLSSVSMAAELALSGMLGDFSAHKDRLESIVANCDSLINLISDILDLEKLEAGKMTLALQATDLNTIIDAVMKGLPGLPEDNLEVANDLAIEFQADQERLSQAIVSLAGFMQLRCHVPSSLRLKTRREGSCLEICLSDSGPLLSENLRQHIFDRYRDFSIDGELSKDGLNTDLRLPLAERIIRAHGGSVRFEAAPDLSNICIVSIPSAEPDM